MKTDRLLWLLLATLAVGPLHAQTTNVDVPAPPPTELGRLSESNRELLDLLKKQQAVLEDIQYDRRLQNRQIQQLEIRLTEALENNAQMQGQVEKLKAELADKTSLSTNAPSAVAPPSTNHPSGATPDNPPGPVSYLPPPDQENGGEKSWHRLFTLSGTDTKSTEPFRIEGTKWRVVWHNQDKAGSSFENTSALFINAFPKDDVIPQKICAKLGSGGDKTELSGPGTYFLKVEASGGSWELAVEDLR